LRMHSWVPTFGVYWRRSLSDRLVGTASPVAQRGVCMELVSARRPRTPSIKVAIVDDHRLVLDGLEARLAQRTSGVVVVATESSWADLLEHRGYPFDVVVLDLHLDDNIPIGTKLRAL